MTAIAVIIITFQTTQQPVLLRFTRRRRRRGRHCRQLSLRCMHAGQIGLCADAIQFRMILEDLRIGKDGEYFGTQHWHIRLRFASIVFLVYFGGAAVGIIESN